MLKYLRELGGAASQFLNALTAGNKDQTFSSRCYEAAVVVGLKRWLVPYWIVNGVAFAIRWALVRVAGWSRANVMPRNHCLDAYLFDTEHTYTKEP